MSNATQWFGVSRQVSVSMFLFPQPKRFHIRPSINECFYKEHLEILSTTEKNSMIIDHPLKKTNSLLVKTWKFRIVKLELKLLITSVLGL